LKKVDFNKIRGTKEELYSEQIDKLSESSSQDPSEDEEKRLSVFVSDDIDVAMSAKEIETDDTGLTLEQTWDDEYKMYKGGGLQWTTNFAYRSKKARRIRPNSEDNFLFNMVEIQVANITANDPQISFKGKKRFAERIKKIEHMARMNDKRNRFEASWEDWVRGFVSYGPLIVEVCWDAEWMGGSGPDRWIGDIKLNKIDKKDFFPDPAILDIEGEKIDECAFLAIKHRVKLLHAQKRFPKFAKFLTEDLTEDDSQHEGGDPEMLDLFKYYHLGFPEYMPEERVRELRERAAKQEAEGDYYKAQELYDMANGDIEGVHQVWYANGVALEYIPYAYDSAHYPVRFTTRYVDENSAWGWGEIRNTKIPQVNHNKADEIEIEAFAKQGLGGGKYQKGAINDRQMDRILETSGKGGMWHEVDNVNLLKDNQGVAVPASITNYKEHKERMIQTISSITPIQQGMSPGSNTPLGVVRELGARTDVRIKKAAGKLEHFLKEINMLRIPLFAQFYTEERFYRYEDSAGQVQEGTFRGDEIFDVWDREQVEIVDPLSGQQMLVPRQEKFIPELDMDVTVLSTKPDDRDYYTQLAFQLYNMQLLTAEHLFYTLDEGQLPPTEDVLKAVNAQNLVMGLVNSVSKFPPEFQQQIVQVVSQIIEQMKGQFAMTEASGKMPNLPLGEPQQQQPQGAKPPGNPGGLNQGNTDLMNNGRM
jgi:hypothetical protein